MNREPLIDPFSKCMGFGFSLDETVHESRGLIDITQSLHNVIHLIFSGLKLLLYID